MPGERRCLMRIPAVAAIISLLPALGPSAEKLTVELFFDTTDDGMGANATSVTQETDRIYALTRIEPAGHAPPVVRFVWGKVVPGRYLSPASGNQRRESFRGIVDLLAIDRVGPASL